MFSPTLPLSLLAALPFISAVPSNSTYNHVINPSPALTPAALNISIPASKKPIPNISIPSNDITVQCLPARYGSKIPIADCIDAVGQIVPDPEIHDWADRHGGYAKRHFPLPFMLMGRKAQCYIEPRLIDSASKGTASLLMISKAAEAIVAKCGSTSSRRVNGGIAYRIGGNNGLSVTLAAYTGPQPICRGSFRDEQTALKCSAPLYGMEAGMERQTFGTAGVGPKPDVLLPAIVKSLGGECVLRVFGNADTAQWYKIWEAAVATFSVCVREAKGGAVKGLGDHGHLFMTLTSPVSLLRNGNETIIEKGQGLMKARD